MPNKVKVVEIDQIREKIVEILKESGVDCPRITADHLIANGVTIATDNNKWIPVTERLPKGGNGEDVAENVIAYLNNGEVIEQVCTGWLSGDEWWLIVGDEDTHTAWGLGAVTHWMPLPTPPKGEEQ